jgi:hypothetical protein
VAVYKPDRALESPICSGIVFVHLTGFWNVVLPRKLVALVVALLRLDPGSPARDVAAGAALRDHALQLVLAHGLPQRRAVVERLRRPPEATVRSSKIARSPGGARCRRDLMEPSVYPQMSNPVAHRDAPIEDVSRISGRVVLLRGRLNAARVSASGAR